MLPVSIDAPVLNVFLPQSREKGAARTAYICNPLIDISKIYVSKNEQEMSGNFKYRLLFNVSISYVIGFMMYTPVQQTRCKPYLVHVGPKLVEEASDEYEISLLLQKLGVLVYKSKTDNSILAVSSYCTSQLAVRLES